MPIYEFYCEPCNTIFNFFSSTVNTEKIPACPRCGNPNLRRQMSVFASPSGRGEDAAEDGMPDIDEARMEKVMAMLAGEAGNLREDDPRGAVKLMRKLSEATGMRLGPAMEEALRRMERGEDPDVIEADLGPQLESEEPLLFSGEPGGRKAGKARPRMDETLYDL